jgi:hypothetical protein
VGKTWKEVAALAPNRMHWKSYSPAGAKGNKIMIIIIIKETDSVYPV